MTLLEMDFMLKSIRVKREGCRLIISGRAFVEGKLSMFMAYRDIPTEQTSKSPTYKMLWFEELNNFNMKGEAK